MASEYHLMIRVQHLFNIDFWYISRHKLRWVRIKLSNGIQCGIKEPSTQIFGTLLGLYLPLKRALSAVSISSSILALRFAGIGAVGPKLM